MDYSIIAKVIEINKTIMWVSWNYGQSIRLFITWMFQMPITLRAWSMLIGNESNVIPNETPLELRIGLIKCAKL